MGVPTRMAATVLVAPRRCENCIRGLYTACLNYGNIKRGHRANGFTTNGGLAEYALNHVNTLYRVPDGVSYEESTVVMTSGSPLFGLENAGGYFAGETVAVLGPGPIGLMAIQLVKALGATRVILTGTRESRLARGRALSLLAAGRLTAKPLITHRFPLSQVHEGFNILEKRIGDPVKVIFNP